MSEKKPPENSTLSASCALPHQHPTIQLAHGSGGRWMKQLLDRTILPQFSNSVLDDRADSAILPIANVGNLAFTTDTFVVTPRFFAGGNIGELAVYGTVNDLACVGATPQWLSCSLILEEGFSMDELYTIVESMKVAAERCGVTIVTGDTKVVDKGKGDGLFVNTAGIGLIANGVDIRPRRVRSGDKIIVSGDIGRHGVAVLADRFGLTFSRPIRSDCAPIHELSLSVIKAGIEVHCMRDPTRGGLAAVMNELANDIGLDIQLDEKSIPIDDSVREACEMLGLDPLLVACEGRLILFVRESDAEKCVRVLRGHEQGMGACVIGQVGDQGGRVILKTQFGSSRLVDMPAGEQLPRIC